MSSESIRRQVIVPYRLILLILVTAILSFCITAAVKSAQARRLETEAKEIQRQVLEAKAYQGELERRLAFTGTDDYVAQEARRRFGYMEKNEIRFVIDGAQDDYEDIDDYI